MNNKQKYLLEHGLCIDCGNFNDGASKYRCTSCLEKVKQKAHLKYKGLPKLGRKGR